MKFVYESYIVPYVRMTRRGKFVDPRAIIYLASKTELGMKFNSAMALNEYDPIPGQTPFRVIASVHHTAGRRADLDNILKAILDAGNGIIYPDDRWCEGIHIERHGSEMDLLTLFVEVLP